MSKRDLRGTNNVFVDYTIVQSGMVDGVLKKAKYDWWKSVPLPQAKIQGLRIIPCVICKRHAKRLDNLYPYDTCYNRCEEHFDANYNPDTKKIAPLSST